jgi:TonB family protein
MRETSTPLILWICAAVCAHFMFAEGGGVVAEVHDDHSFLKHMASQIRDKVRDSEQTFEVGGIYDSAAKPDEKPPEPPPPPKPEKKDEKKDIAIEQKKPEPPKPEPPKKKDEVVKVVVTPKDPAKALEPPPVPMKDKRIAVKQHAKPDQEDNPEARFIGDDANHVKEESVATVTAHDQDDPNPSPGGNHAGPNGQPGDSEKTRVADSDEHKGEQNRRPGEKGTEFDVQKEPMPERPMGPVAIKAQASQEPPRGGGDGRTAQDPKAATQPELAQGGAAPPAPDVAQGADSNWSFNPVRPGAGAGSAQETGQGKTARNSPSPGRTNWLGLGGQVGPGQINLNLTQQGVVAVVGQDSLRKEREADGERRRSEHRGSWQASNFERWRNAIENYVSVVKPGNQTALNTARQPFATYLVQIHNRIHPIFADNFLGGLDNLPPQHPLNNQRLITKLEIVVTREGRVVKMGVVKPSGVTAFDIAALDSVQRASPFGPAPSAIISGDGNVYLHWEFHREEAIACTTSNAYPYILNNAPKPADPGGLPPNTPPGNPEKPSPTQERGAPPPVNINESRQGMRQDSRPHSHDTLSNGAPG